MSSINLPRLTNDDLVNRRKEIIQSIESVRIEKGAIAETIRALGAKKPQQNKVMEDMTKLLAVYDDLAVVETQYIEELKAIVTLHEQLTMDIANEFQRKVEENARRLRDVSE